MKKSWLTKRLAAFVLAPSVVLAGFAIALPATFFSVAEKANATDRAATDHTGPIGDKENDPWPQSFPRDNSLNHLSNMKSGRIALLFDFDARYTWETMGGKKIPKGWYTEEERNFDQSRQLKEYISNLKGAPVQVGIYTFDNFSRKDKYQNVAWGNTPDLPATSLENKEGFDKVMKKLDSLDATDGSGNRKNGNQFDYSNQEQGLQKVINDMQKYHYTDVFLFTVGSPNRCGVNDGGCFSTIESAKQDPEKAQFLRASGALNDQGNFNDVFAGNKWEYSRDGVIAAALKAYELQKTGANLRIMHMYTKTGVNERAIKYAQYMFGGKISWNISQLPGDKVADYVDLTVPDAMKDKWITIRHVGRFEDYYEKRNNIYWNGQIYWEPGEQFKRPGGDANHSRLDGKDILQACNNWHGIGGLYVPSPSVICEGEPRPQQDCRSKVTLGRIWQGDSVKLGGDDNWQNGFQSMACNHVRDGKFGQTVVNWLQKASGLAIINDQVDQDLRFIKPNAERSFKVTKDGGQAVTKKTEGDGMFDLDSTDGRVTSVELAEANPTEQITPFADKYVNGQAQGELHNARCVGWNAARKPELFHPENLNNADGVPIGFKFTAEQKSKYQLAKCAMYSRPLQETQIVKQAEVKNEQIRFVVGGAPIANTKPTEYQGTRASYVFKWECTDPRNENRVVANSDGNNGKRAIPEAERTRDINGLNVSTELPAVSLGKVPVGSKCEVTETINLPYDRKTETIGSAAVQKRAKQLFTSENKVEGRNYQLADTKDFPHDGQAAVSITTATVLYQKADKGQPVSQLVSKTYYESKKAGIKLRLKITNKAADPGFSDAFIQAKRGQTSVPVYYNCRFVPDPAKPPELPEKNQGSYPGYVEVGWKPVPIPANVNEFGAEVEIGYDKNGKPAWPVGAHCLFSTNVPAADMNVDSQPLNITGFKSEDSYASTVCNKDWKESDRNLRDCGNNYFWVRSDGEQKIELTQDFKRQYGKIEVSKLLSGEAQSQGIGKAYDMKLQCANTPSLENDTANFKVIAGVPKTVANVPVGTTCFLTETKPVMDNVEVTPPHVKTIDTSDIINQPKKVEVTNTFAYKKPTLKINFTSDFRENLSDSAVQEEINKHPKKINVRCTDLDGRPSTHDFTATGQQGSLGSLKVASGSKCQVSSGTSGFGVTVTKPESTPKVSSYRVQVISDTVEVDVPEQGNTATINLSFLQPTAGQLSIISKVNQWPSYRVIKNKLPKQVIAAITCAGSANTIWSGNLDLDMRNPRIIENTSMPANSSCQLKLGLPAEVSWPSQVDRQSVLKVGDTESAPNQNQSSMSFTFTSPPENQGSALTLNHTFSAAMTKAMFSVKTPEFWTSADPKEAEPANQVPVPDSWKQALLAENAGGTATVPGTVNCKLDNSTKTSYSVAIPRGSKPAELEVPRGWECNAQVATAALQVRGTDLKSSQWTQNGTGATATTQDYTVGNNKPVGITWTSGEKPFVAALQSEHRVQLASFNLKKKVGGEGVAMIAGDRLYAVKYTCKLNNQDIQLPKPADINNPGKPALENGSPWDAAAHLKAELGGHAGRLQDLAPERTVKIGRFQQGEWHPIDALPAGAVCTLEETDGDEMSSRWDNYWEITPGYRSREKESKCEAASEKCRPVANGNTQKVEVFLPTNKQPSSSGYDRANDKGYNNHPLVPEKLPENFAGTMVPWNNYKFDKVQVKVTMQLEGNGAALATDQTLRTRLYCKPPALKDAQDNLVASDANAAQVIKVPLEFKKDKDSAPDWPITITASQQVPVNYRCVLAQEDIRTGDGYVDTKIEYTAISKNQSSDNTFAVNQKDPAKVKEALQKLFTTKSSDTSSLSDLSEYESDTNLHLGENESFIAGFKVPAKVDSASDAIDLTLTNTVQRQGVNLSAKHVMDAGTSGYYNLGSQDLDNPTYKLHYECDDKYLRDASDTSKPLQYTGTIVLNSNGSLAAAGTKVFDASSLQTAGGEVNETRFMPASSSCKFQLQNASGDPIAGYDTVHLLTTGKVANDLKLAGRFDNEMKSSDRDPAKLNVVPVVFEKYVQETSGSTDPNVSGSGASANGSSAPAPSTSDPGTAPGGAASPSNPTGSNPNSTGGTAAGANNTPTNMEPLTGTLTFSTWYFTPQQVYTLRTYAVGNYADKVINPAKFSYTYTCDYKNLPGHSFSAAEQTVGDVEAGKPIRLGKPNCVTDSAGKQVCSEMNVVPEGTSCTVTGTQPQVPPDMDYLKLVTNQVDSTKLMAFDAQGQPTGDPDFTSKAITNATVVSVDSQKKFKVTFRPATPGETTPPPSDVSIGHIVYRNGAEIYVRRVDKPTAGSTTGTTVPGAKFDLYYSNADGNIDTSRLVKIAAETSNPGVYKATLAPGTYWLGTTDTGKGNQTELLWQRYKFEVKVTKDNACANTDTFVKLAPETEHSGLVDLQQRQLENTPTSGTGTNPATPGGNPSDPGNTPGSTGSTPLNSGSNPDPSGASNPTSGTTTGGTTAPAVDPQDTCLVNAAQGFTKWDVDVADIRFGDLPLTGGRLPWILGAAGAMLGGAVALMIRNRRRYANNA